MGCHHEMLQPAAYIRAVKALGETQQWLKRDQTLASHGLMEGAKEQAQGDESKCESITLVEQREKDFIVSGTGQCRISRSLQG
jgi:hypothetical protein